MPVTINSDKTHSQQEHDPITPIDRQLAHAGEAIGMRAGDIVAALAVAAINLGELQIKGGGEAVIATAYSAVVAATSQTSYPLGGVSSLRVESNRGGIEAVKALALRMHVAIALLGLSSRFHGAQGALAGNSELLAALTDPARLFTIHATQYTAAPNRNKTVIPSIGADALAVQHSRGQPLRTTHPEVVEKLAGSIPRYYRGAEAVLLNAYIVDDQPNVVAVETRDLGLSESRRAELTQNYRTVIPYPVVDALRLFLRLNKTHSEQQLSVVISRLLDRQRKTEQKFGVDPWQAVCINAMRAIAQAQKQARAATS